MEKLKLSDIRKELKIKMTYGTTTYSIKDFCFYDDITIDYDVYLPSIGKNLQRPFCWSLLQKQELIISLLKGITIPNFVICQYKDENKHITYKIIDGKQRLSTIISFYKNEFPIIFNGNEYFYSDFDEKTQMVVAHFSPLFNICYEYYDKPIDDITFRDWFEMINFSGTPQDIEHMNNLKS